MYVPIFSSILDGSLRETDVTTRWVFLTMLILGDEAGDGTVRMTLSALAGRANVPLEDCRKAIEELSAPDPNSTSSKEAGSRIILLDPNKPGRDWMIVTWPDYAQMRSKAALRESWRKSSAKYRERSQLAEAISHRRRRKPS
jgi:hypothetical protein